MKYAVRSLLMIVLLFVSSQSLAQEHIAGVLYKPYINDLVGIGNRWEQPIGIKNLKLAYQYLPSDGISWCFDYNRASLSLSEYKYKISSDVFGFALGECTRHVFKKTHFSGYLIGLRVGFVTYSIQPEFIDPFGTMYVEYHKKSRLEGALTLHYYYYLPFAGSFYLLTKGGFVISPQNSSNPLDNLYPNFNWVPFFSPVGGALPWFNLEFNAGLCYRFGKNDSGN